MRRAEPRERVGGHPLPVRDAVIGLDTNVLVRYLTLDDPAQSAVAVELIEDAARSGEALFVSPIVLCEVAWVLDRAYGYPKPEIETALEALLRAAQLRFPDPTVLWQALSDYRDGRGDFADYVIGREARAAGCGHMVTFDRGLRGEPGFQVL